MLDSLRSPGSEFLGISTPLVSGLPASLDEVPAISPLRVAIRKATTPAGCIVLLEGELCLFLYLLAQLPDAKLNIDHCSVAYARAAAKVATGCTKVGLNAVAKRLKVGQHALCAWLADDPTRAQQTAPTPASFANVQQRALEEFQAVDA